MTNRFSFDQGSYELCPTGQRLDLIKSELTRSVTLSEHGVNEEVVIAMMNEAVGGFLGKNAPAGSTSDLFAIEASESGRLREVRLVRDFLQALKKHNVISKNEQKLLRRYN